MRESHAIALDRPLDKNHQLLFIPAAASRGALLMVLSSSSNSFRSWASS